MVSIQALLTVADAYAVACDVPETTVSKRALSDSSRLAELRSGQCDIGVKRAERTLQWFSDHWPDADWPTDVPRPDPAPDAPLEHAGRGRSASAIPELSPEPSCPRNNGFSGGPGR